MFDEERGNKGQAVLICGYAGTGKTTYIGNFILARACETYDEIHIFTRFEEPIYAFLKEKLPEKIYLHNTLKDITNLQPNMKKKMLLVFDEMKETSSPELPIIFYSGNLITHSRIFDNHIIITSQNDLK